MSGEILNFDQDLRVVQEVEVIWEKKKYTLRTASGGASVVYDNTRFGYMMWGEDGKSKGLKSGYANIEPLLVSLCLFDEEGNNVPEAVIRKWPSFILNDLYTKARQISYFTLDDDADSIREKIVDLQKQLAEVEAKEETLKNSSSDTQGG